MKDSDIQIYLSKVDKLIVEGEPLTKPDKIYDQSSNGYSTHGQYYKIYSWLIAANVFIRSIIKNDSHIYYHQMKLQLDAISTYNNSAYIFAGAALGILKRIKDDISDGLIGDLINKFEAETFDDFLSHAEEYFKEEKKMESGVISGVVFEDTIRKICKKVGIEEKDQKLEHLINALKTKGHIEKTKASRCKTASAVRGTAAHANWDDLDINSVRDTIALTRELLGEFLER